MRNEFTNKEKKRLTTLVKETRGRLSQRSFAELLGVSYSAIQDWEKGVGNATDDSLWKLADAKGWSLKELKEYLYTEKYPELSEFRRVLDYLGNLHPEQIISAYRVLNGRTAELLHVAKERETQQP